MNNFFRIERLRDLIFPQVDKWTLGFTLVGLIYGVVVAVASGYFGVLVLAGLLGGIALVWVILKPDLGITMILIVLFAQVQRAFVEVNGWPGPGRPLVVFLLGVVAIRFFLFNERPVTWLNNSFLIGIYALSLLVSVVMADHVDVAFVEFQDVVQNLLIASIILFVVQKSPSLKKSIWAVIFAGIFMASISVYQNLTQTFDNTYFGFGGWEYSGYVGRPRMTGPYETPNPYAQILAVIFIFALDRAWHESNSFYRFGSIFGAGVIALALIYTDSRGGFLSFAVTIVIYLFFNRPSIFSVTIIALIGLLMIQFMPANYTDRLLTLAQVSPFKNQSSQLTDESFRGRTSENLAAWRMFLDNPVFGVGLENYQLYYLDYSRQIGLDPRREERDPASLYLELLANQGLVGTLIYLTIILVVFSRLYSARKQLIEMGCIDEAYIASALFAALAGYMFMSIYKNSAYTNAFWSLMSLCLALTQVTMNIQNDREINRTLGGKA